MISPSSRFADLLARVQKIGIEVVRPAADEVDRQARFPGEAFAALRAERLLSAGIPEALGGHGLPVTEVGALCHALAQHCAATAMIFAMHQIQIASLARHGLSSSFFRGYLAEAAEKQRLIASVTSETGVGGDMRSSLCAIEPSAPGLFRLHKVASVISYGEHADALLITSRRAPDAPANDQSLTLLRKDQYTLEKTGVWDTLGMRGTCSPSFKMTGEGATEQILPVSFGDIAAQTMVPYSHLVWGNCWMGIASDAVTRARAFIRADARRRPGTVPFGGSRLVEVTNQLQAVRTQIAEIGREYETLMSTTGGAETLSTVGYAIKINNLKLGVSQSVVQMVSQCLTICGMAGYSNASKFSMGRQLRDAHSAALMIANDRITQTNAALLLVFKDD